MWAAERAAPHKRGCWLVSAYQLETWQRGGDRGFAELREGGPYQGARLVGATEAEDGRQGHRVRA